MASSSQAPLVVGIGGTIGFVSSTERALGIALDAAAREGFRTRLFGGEDMARLPLYNPRAATRTDDERAFVDAVRGHPPSSYRAPAITAASRGWSRTRLISSKRLRAMRGRI
jgi:hypothetical protein